VVRSVLTSHSFGTGYFRDPWDIERNEWFEATRRAKGYINIRVQEEYAKAFKWSNESPPPYSVVAPAVADQAFVNDLTNAVMSELRILGIFSRR
jgi:hypothetical protein